MRTEVYFISDDGRHFDDAEECLEYEKTVHQHDNDDWSYTNLIMLDRNKEKTQLNRMSVCEYPDTVAMFDNAEFYVVRTEQEKAWFTKLEHESMRRIFGEDWEKDWAHERDNIYPEQYGIWFYDMNVDHYVELNHMSLDIDNLRDDILRMI